jgi:hypothetical protein
MSGRSRDFRQNREMAQKRCQKSAARKKSLNGVHEVAGGLRFRNVAVCPPRASASRRADSCTVKIRARVEGSSLPLSRAASEPLMPGMDTSRTTTWGCGELMATIASLPWEASPQTSRFFRTWREGCEYLLERSRPRAEF